jgi:hypothetical protein
MININGISHLNFRVKDQKKFKKFKAILTIIGMLYVVFILYNNVIDFLLIAGG